MNQLKLVTLVSMVCLLYSCGSSDDDCTKTIVIPQYYFANNQSYSYDIEQKVSCDTPEPDDAPVLITPPELENFSYEVLNFIWESDTGNNTSRLRFEIQLNNGNDYAVEGIPILTISSGGLQFSGSYSNEASVPCFELPANGYCVLTYDQESSLDLGTTEDFQLMDVHYYLTN